MSSIRTIPRFLSCLFSALLAGAGSCAAERVCRPALSLTDIRFSEVRPGQQRRWSAIVIVDASRCATRSGPFEIGFLRQKEPGGELEFHELFAWSAPSVAVAVEFWEDEAMETWWINVPLCPCAKDGAAVAHGPAGK